MRKETLQFENIAKSSENKKTHWRLRLQFLDPLFEQSLMAF